MIKRGQLKAPVQKGFNETDWQRALRDIKEPTDEDRRIYASAIFFGAQLAGLRKQLEIAPPPAGAIATQIRRCVGLANRECTAVYLKTIKKPIDDPFWIHKIIENEIPLAGNINRATASEILESVVDGLRFELATLHERRNPGAAIDGLSAIERLAFRANMSVFYHMLEEQWLDSLHHGWGVESNENGTVIAPVANPDEAVDAAVGQFRSQALDLEIVERTRVMVAKNGTPQKHNGIVSKRGKRREYAIAQSSLHIANEVFFARVLASEKDLLPFLNFKADANSGLTIHEMLELYLCLTPLAEEIAARSPTKQTIRELNQLEQFAPLQNLPELGRALAKCTGIPIKKCEAAIDLLTWKNGRDSVWHRPIIPTGTPGQGVIVIAALRYPNLRRSIEYWFVQGGDDLSKRGYEFEDSVRIDLRDAIAENSRLSATGVAAASVKPTDSKIGNIDLLAWINDTVLIGEIKCLLRPATSYEWFQYDDTVTKAVMQAQRKAAWVQQNKGWLEKVTGRIVAGDAPKVIPCVVTNLPSGSLRTIDGVPIVDQYLLNRYFGIGHGTMFVLSTEENSGIDVHFYSNEIEAESNLKKYLHSPRHLPYKNHVTFDSRLQPDFVDPSRQIAMMFPKVCLKIPDNWPTTTNSSAGQAATG